MHKYVKLLKKPLKALLELKFVSTSFTGRKAVVCINNTFDVITG